MGHQESQQPSAASKRVGGDRRPRYGYDSAGRSGPALKALPSGHLGRNRMDVHLIDGTYELFRHFFAVPAAPDVNGQEIGAVRGVLTSVLSMIERGATHVGVATDHVVESFRNDLYPA